MHSLAKTQNELLTILWPEGEFAGQYRKDTNFADVVQSAGLQDCPCLAASPVATPLPRRVPAPVPAPVYVYSQVSSTLDVVHELARTAPLSPWTSVLAYSQTGGRGQLRRSWQSPVGNVYAAVRLPAQKPFTEAACAPAVGGLFAYAMRRMGLEVCVKWPNDLVLWHGRDVYKIGGILVEEHQHGIWAGVGINILHSPPKGTLRPEHALSASHLGALMPSFLSSDEFHNVSLFWMRLVKEAFSWYETGVFEQDTWCDLVNSVLLWRGSTVNLTDDNSSFCAKLLGISPSGALCLELQGGVKEFFSGSLRACV